MFENAISPEALDTITKIGINVGIAIIKIAVVLGIGLLHVAYATYFERKVIGHMQVRLGPMRVGPHGLLQPIADGLKLFFKEDIIPANADKPLFYLGPVIFMAASMVNLSVIPFASNFVIANINVGLLFIFAIAGMGVYGIFISGWASNSKYAFIGGLRSSAQVLSYEIPMGLSLVGVMIMAGSLNLNDIVKAQRDSIYGMYVIPQFVAFIAAVFFPGGWSIPWYITKALPFLSYVPGIVWFLLKVYAFIFFYYWIRATVPRYRYDQLMAIGWKVLIPISLANLVCRLLLEKKKKKRKDSRDREHRNNQ